VAARCESFFVNTKLKGKKLDLAQLGKAIVDAATSTDQGRKTKEKKPSNRDAVTKKVRS